MPKLSSSTLAIGARQLVVHDAFEISWALATRSASLTPRTTVASRGSFDGTGRMTRCARAGDLTHHRCVLEQVGGHLIGGEVVDGHDLDSRLGPLIDHSEYRTSDPAEPADGDPPAGTS